MPKIRTKKAMSKRYRITRKGKVRASKALRRHMMTDRTPKKKRQARRGLSVHKSHVKSILMRLPYNR